MKNLIIILLFASLIGWFYPIAAGITYCDVMVVPIVVLSLGGFMFNKWKTDYFLRGSFIYCLLILLSGIINETLTNTVFQNFFRIQLIGIIAYCCILNCLKSKQNVRVFFFCLLAFIAYFIYFSFDLLEQSFEAVKYTDIEFGYGRNNWGFSCFLISCIIFFLSYYKIGYSRPLLIFIPILFCFMVFSASRMALIAFIITIIAYRLWINKPITLKEVLSIIFIGGGSFVIISYMTTMANANILNFVFGFIEHKMGYVQNDAIDNRLGNLNFIAIEEFWENRYFYENIFGDGLSVRHGIFAQIYTATGIIGFVQYMFYHIRTFIVWHKLRDAQWAQWLLVIMFINDIVTNASFIIGLNNYLFMISCAFILQYAKIKNRFPHGDVKQPWGDGTKCCISN